MSAIPNGEGSAAALQKARSAIGSELESCFYSHSATVLDALLENPALREPHLLVLLSRRDLPSKIIVQISRNNLWMRSYAMKAAVLKHPLTPRQVSLPLLKQVYLGDLLSIATTPGLKADLKRLAEDAILGQLQSIPAGQRRTLAHRGSHRLAGGMLLDSDSRVLAAALENPAMTDHGVAQALVSDKADASLTQLVLGDARWMARRPVKLGMLRNRHLSLAGFISLLGHLTAAELADLGLDPRLPRNLRDYVKNYLASRRRRVKTLA